MLQTSTFSRGQWIVPPLAGDWLATAKAPVYWVACRAFGLPGKVQRATVRLAADRHCDLLSTALP